MAKTEETETRYRLLIEQVKAIGRELEDRAENLVGQEDLLIDFEIRLRFSRNEAPVIEVNRGYYSKECIAIYRDNRWDGRRSWR